MLKKRVICLFLFVLLVLSSCVTSPSEPEGEGQTPPVGGEMVPAVAPPDEGEEGAFFAASFAELEAAVTSLAFLSFDKTPTLCITEPFALERAVRVSRLFHLTYLPEECAWENPLTLVSGEAGEVVVATLSRDLWEMGAFGIDAPHAQVVLRGDVPAEDVIDLYCNANSVNGAPADGVWGGTCANPISSLALSSASSFEVYEGASVSLVGNALIVGVPLVVPEADVKSARVSFLDAEGRVLTEETLDLSMGSDVTVTDGENNSRTYFVTSTRLHYDVPVLMLTTEGGVGVQEKNTYVPGTLTVDGETHAMQIRGRGNASWNMFPKKAYRIKLDRGASLFGLAQNRDWVLASNYADKSLIRNCVAHTLAKQLDGLEYTPTHVPVNLYLDGEYLGVYTFSDKIEDGNGRLDLKNGETPDPENVGFLLEIGWDFDHENVYNRDYFDTEIVIRIFVKEPEIERANTKEFLYLKNYILEMEEAIVTNDGWEEYIDLDSWVDWFLINELTFNTESSFYRSCYLYRPAGEKLRLGPVWDFDMAFGNHLGDLYGYNGFCTTESTYHYIRENWMNYLLKYPAFTDRLVERWEEKKDDLLETGLCAVEEYSAAMSGSQEQNFLVWDIMDKQVGVASVSPSVYNTYEKQIEYLKTFLQNRWNYLDTRIGAM